MMLLLLMIAFQLHASPASAHRSENPSSVEAKVQQLVELTRERPIVKFSDDLFRDYVKSGPKNYSVVVIFTGKDCSKCEQVHDELAIVANSYRYSRGFSKMLFFAMADFDESLDVFQKFQMNSPPVITHFPSKGKPKLADTINFEKFGISAEIIAKWIQERTNIQIRIIRPANYSGVVTVIILILLCGGFFYLRRNSLDFISNRQMWAVGAVFFCLIMISGQMWNQIRGPPFVRHDKNGRISFIQNSTHGQYVLETYIIMGLNNAIVVGMILLAESGGGVKAEKMKEKNPKVDYRKRRILAYFGLALVCVFFSLLLSVFRTKVQSYPYRESFEIESGR